MAQSTTLNQVATQLGIDLNTATPVDQLLVYKHTLEELRNLLLYEIDLRQFTSDSMKTIEADLRAIIGSIDKVNNNSSGTLRSPRAVVNNLLQARNEVYLALETLENSGRTPEFFLSLTRCQEYLAEALQYM